MQKLSLSSIGCSINISLCICALSFDWQYFDILINYDQNVVTVCSCSYDLKLYPVGEYNRAIDLEYGNL